MAVACRSQRPGPCLALGLSKTAWTAGSGRPRLGLSVPKVVFKAIEGAPAKDQPVYRVYAEGADGGAAWRCALGKGVGGLSVSLDDPSLLAPLSPRRLASEAGSARA
jgi:uncharacterized protein (DUF736 family)